jgi:cytosine/adenosine deaminase-related metal-dependent hydrolase
MPNQSITLAARYVFPVEDPPIARGIVEVRDGKIEYCGPPDGRSPDLDLGNAAVVPGFVNAHTHLELAPIERAAGNEVEDEIDWLRRVVSQRRASSPRALERAVESNLREVRESGTTFVADITTAGASWHLLSHTPIRAVVFSEIIGIGRMRGLQTSEEAWDWLARVREHDSVGAHTRPGLSPHAPYSTAGWLYERAAASRLPLTTHLAEMPEELELLRDRSGRLREFLEELGAWDESWEPIGPRPTDYIRRGELRRADWLVAHGTYLDADDFWQLRPEAAPEDQRVAIVYCPRTHARFGHAPHPFREMLQRGVVVCLGTDSRASNPTLSILDEIRFLHRKDSSLGGPLLLTMATLFGAWALRGDGVTGSLKPGKSADLAIVALPDRDERDPHLLLLESNLPVLATMFEGAFVTGLWSNESGGDTR